MKIWLIALPLLFAVSVAKADEQTQPGPQDQAAPPPAKPVHAKKHKHSVRPLPRGDLRYCLELKDNEAIIRCAETGRKN